MMVWKRKLPSNMAIFGINSLDFWGVFPMDDTHTRTMIDLADSADSQVSLMVLSLHRPSYSPWLEALPPVPTGATRSGI